MKGTLFCLLMLSTHTKHKVIFVKAPIVVEKKYRISGFFLWKSDSQSALGVILSTIGF